MGLCQVAAAACNAHSGGLLKQAVGVGHVARKGGQELGGHLAVVHAVVGCSQEMGGRRVFTLRARGVGPQMTKHDFCSRTGFPLANATSATNPTATNWLVSSKGAHRTA